MTGSPRFPVAPERIILPAVPESAARARAFVHEHLRASARDGSLEDSALLCVTELIANVFRHTASRECVVTVVDEPGHLLIEVADDSPEMPQVAVIAPESEHGRGLRIVDALAGEWGVRCNPGRGKAVWLRLPDCH